MKKITILALALFLSACVNNNKEATTQKAISLLTNPEFLANQQKCLQEKHALSCVYVADAMLNDEKAKDNIKDIVNYYNIACTLGAVEGCEKVKKFL